MRLETRKIFAATYPTYGIWISLAGRRKLNPMQNSVHVKCMLQAITCMLHNGFHNMHVGLHVTLTVFITSMLH